jgi:thioredoxin 1
MSFNEDILKTPITVVKFGAKWCSACNMLLNGPWPKLIEANPTIKFLDIDVDIEKEMPKEFNFTSIPVVIFFKDGKETNRLVGLQLQAKYQEIIDGLTKAEN